MSATERDDFVEQLRELEAGRLSSSQIYGMIHELGEAGAMQARPVIERFLVSPNASLRYIALEVLTGHLCLQEHWQTARRFLEADPDRSCRRMGASSLLALKRDTRDVDTLTVLAMAVNNDREDRIVRQAAYRAMLGVLHYDPVEQSRIAGRDLDFGTEIDWSLVSSYLIDPPGFERKE